MKNGNSNMVRPELETVDQNIVERVPTAAPTDKVGATLKTIRAGAWATTNYLYVLDDEKLVGVVPMRTLLEAKDSERLEDIMTTELFTVHPHDDQERASIVAIRHNIKAVPVVERSGKFRGVVSAQQILRILHIEHTEDFLRLAGVMREHPVTDVLQTSLARLVRLRLPWLVVGFGGGIVATFVAGLFEATLAAKLALVFFIPLVMYMGAAVGNQTLSIYLRSLTLHPMSFSRYALRELGVGGVLALFFSGLVYFFAYVWVGEVVVATAIAVAMFATIVLAPLIAMTIPTVLYLAKKDPALGAGPFANVVQDIASLVIYFAVTTALLL